MNSNEIIERLARRAAARWGAAWLSLGIALVVAAQEPEGAFQTNELSDAEVLARLGELIQAVGAGQPDDSAPPPPPFSPAQNQIPGGDRGSRVSHSDSHAPNGSIVESSNRSQKEDRRSRNRRSSRSRPDQSRSSSSGGDSGRSTDRYQIAPPAGTNTNPASLDYAAFRIIVERNIFDPNRYPPQSGPPTRPPTRVDSLTLVGTMSYEKGEFAFFDGTSSDYRKALKLSDMIAGYKVADITPTAVSLASGTNELKLGVGMQLRRDEEGPWHLSSQSTSYSSTFASNSTSTSTASTNQSPTSSDADSDVIKRLMQRRQQE